MSTSRQRQLSTNRRVNVQLNNIVQILKMNSPPGEHRSHNRTCTNDVTTVQKSGQQSLLFVRLSLYSVAFYSGLEEANDVMSGAFVRLIVPDNFVELGDSRLHYSREI